MNGLAQPVVEGEPSDDSQQLDDVLAHATWEQGALDAELQWELVASAPVPYERGSGVGQLVVAL
jgi:hypothetical protein